MHGIPGVTAIRKIKGLPLLTSHASLLAVMLTQSSGLSVQSLIQKSKRVSMKAKRLALSELQLRNGSLHVSACL